MTYINLGHCIKEPYFSTCFYPYFLPSLPALPTWVLNKSGVDMLISITHLQEHKAYRYLPYQKQQESNTISGIPFSHTCSCLFAFAYTGSPPTWPHVFLGLAENLPSTVVTYPLYSYDEF